MSQKDQSHTQPTKSPVQSGSNSIAVVTVSVIIAVAISFVISRYVFPAPRIAYVDTGKLMVGFNEANKVKKELQEVEKEWQSKIKILNDSLAAQVEKVSKEFDNASLQRKQELQTQLSILNQQVNKG